MELAIIIPALNAETHLRARLKQLSGERVVVSDGGSGDKSLAVALEGGAVLALGAKGRGGQLRRGADLAMANLAETAWMLFLHADTELPPDWRAVMERHIRAHPDKAGYFKYGAKGERGPWGLWLRAIIRFREVAWGLPYGDQGLLISVGLYRELGGYPDVPLMEDVEMVRRLHGPLCRNLPRWWPGWLAFGKLIGGRLRRLDGRIATDASDYRRDGLWRRGVRNLSILKAHRKGASYAQIVERYR